MNQRVPQTTAELEEHLADHIEFLKSSAQAFDAGFESEAKRLAVSLRVLLHDTQSSHSLLGQLGRLSGRFLSTALPHDGSNLATHGGLVFVAMAEGATRYVAMLDDVPVQQWMPFHDWWEETVFVDDQRAKLTRRQLVTAVANQDGGAHVDPALGDTYARLSRHNSMGWVISSAAGTAAIPGAERAAIRQVAHEVLRTLIPGYALKPAHEADMFVGGSALHAGTTAPPIRKPPVIGRNEQCPCGSGRKYKKCHG